MKVELDENESYVVAYLHSHQMYDRGEQEMLFYTNFPVWYRRQTGDEIPDKRLEKAVNNLLKLKFFIKVLTIPLGAGLSYFRR